jgi:hypothetical protein
MRRGGFVAQVASSDLGIFAAHTSTQKLDRNAWEPPSGLKIKTDESGCR